MESERHLRPPLSPLFLPIFDSELGLLNDLVKVLVRLNFTAQVEFVAACAELIHDSLWIERDCCSAGPRAKVQHDRAAWPRLPLPEGRPALPRLHALPASESDRTWAVQLLDQAAD